HRVEDLRAEGSAETRSGSEAEGAARERREQPRLAAAAAQARGEQRSGQARACLGPRGACRLQRVRGQDATAPGEWALYLDVGGIWTHVRPLVLRVRDGQRVRLRQRFDLFVPRGRSWRLAAFTRECDFGFPTFSRMDRAVYPCPRTAEFGHPTGDDRPGYLAVPGALGLHRTNALLDDSTCPPVNKNGCYRLTWRVTEVRGPG